MNIKQLDHFVITLNHRETLNFYRALGFEVIQFNSERYAIQLGAQKINIHFNDQTILPRAAHPGGAW